MQFQRVFFTLIVLFSFLTQSFAENNPSVVLLNKGSAREVAYSPDGMFLAVAGGLGIWLYPTQTDEPVTLIEHPNQISRLSFSADGKTLASSDVRSNVLLWDVSTGELQNKYEANRGSSNIALSPDGQIVALASRDGLIRMWDVRIDTILYTLEAHPNNYLQCMLFSPDGQTLASGGTDNIVNLWDVSTGELLHTLKKHVNGVEGVSFSPDGKILASCSFDNNILMWDVQTGKLDNAITAPMNWIFSVSFSPDGQTLAVGGQSVQIWDVNTLSLLHNLNTDNIYPVNSVSFSPDGKTLASVSSQNSNVSIWDISVGRLQQTLTEHSSAPWDMSFSSDGQTLASINEGVISMLDVRSGNVQHTLKGNTVSFHPDGETVAIAGLAPTVRVLNISTGEIQHTLDLENDPLYISFNRNGQTLAILDRNSTIHLWDVTTDSLLHIPTEYAHFIGIRYHGFLSFSPDLQYLAISRPESTIHLLDVNTGNVNTHSKVTENRLGVYRSVQMGRRLQVQAGIKLSVCGMLKQVNSTTYS